MLTAGMKWLAILFLLLAIESPFIGAAKILTIFPFQARSHMIMGSALAKELVSKGHEVTMLSHFPQKEKIANYTDVYIKTTMLDLVGAQGHANKFFDDKNTGFKERVGMMSNMLSINTETCDMMLQEEEVHKLIHDNNAHFDLVIIEAFFNECFLGFVHKFKAPLIQVCTFGGINYMLEWFGNPTPYSYIPEVFLPYSNKMNLWERTINTVVGIGIKAARQCLYLPGMDAIMKKNFGFLEGLPSINELERGTSVLFLNDHFSISYSRPFVPGIVQVGGLHVKPPKKLPKDLQDYLDDAPNGVIYFSLGSNLQSSEMPESKRNALLEAFSQLKQKVLWKWESDTLPGQPSNVKIGKWLPQTDILAHPNVRAFITHGGLLSTQEAMNRGIPVVGIPIFADQSNNMQKAQLAGFGVLLDFKNVTTESVKWAIAEILENPRYAENAQRISRIFRDQPLTPLDQAMFWTEYVIRHKGAPHMRSAALDLTWYQYFLLDVTAFVTKWLTLVVLLVTTRLTLIEAAKILTIFPFQSRSHMIMGSALAKELAESGHDVTMISHFPEKNKIPNYTDIYVETTMMDVAGNQGTANKYFEEKAFGLKETIETATNMFHMNQVTCDKMLQEEAVHRLIHDKDAHFDVIIMEAFLNDCFLGFVHKFKAPLIEVCTFGGAHYMDDWFGNPRPFSYVPDTFMAFTDNMNIWEKILNTLIGTTVRLLRSHFYVPGMNEVLKKNFGFLEGLPTISEIECNISLLLMNDHFSFSYPRPFMPGMVQVGGLHVKPPKNLPKDLQEYLDDAPNGVIFFSLGSNLQSSEMPESKRSALLEAFSQLKQKVLWKWESDTLPGQPSNVRLGKWLPQTDILAHPNIRVFITHGGLLSTQEAMHRGVPVVGIPVFGDQLTNMKKAQMAGLGVTVNFKDITAESVKTAITEVIENPKYAENAQRISRIFRDQPQTPLERAVYWTEYVIRHKGAPHMRSVARDLAWYQHLLLDVIAVLMLALGTILFFVYFVIRAALRVICGRSKSKIQVSDKKKKH
ncbi:hypothetical protein L9F63_000307 [Diploptera punctata]|uniref:UDP-glycosyltransferases domain-containing protein n=1 Tax=Diploptera punctata TaxID=6984 RepID=A0AAD8AM02_DIPPU|nr:hypothetical protein L9F63_000307 [Diploptera punctata]